METGSNRPPLLFVHGAWHGAWCWDDYFLPWFRERGWNCAVVHLRGHGDGLPAARLRWLSAARYLDDLCTAIQRQPRPPVLVAHSMGGYLALKVLERHRLPGAALLAPVPIMGSLPAFVRSIRAEPRMVLGGTLALDASRIMSTPQLARRFLFTPGTPEVTVRRACDHIGGESMLAVVQTALDLPRPAAIRAQGAPLLLVTGADDGLFTLAEQRRTAQALGALFVPIDHAGHDLMLGPRWEAAACAIDDWLRVNFQPSEVKVC